MIVGGIGVRDIAANRGPVAHHRVCDHRGGIEQNGIAVSNEAGTVEFRLACQRANVQRAIRFLNVFQASNTIDVNQRGWPGDAEPHEGNEALASGQNFGVTAMLIEQGNSFVDTVRYQIIEGTRNQVITSRV